MRSSYKEEDVILLLKDITGMIEPKSTEEREKLIQGGRHYSEMLPIEYVPSEKYMKVYEESLDTFSETVANAVGVLSDKIVEQKGKEVVLVSLARAGTPVGILIKRYLKWKYNLNIPHYSISIIRDRGIDKNAINFLLGKYKPENLLFVDGWIGKGAILRELEKDLKDYPKISPDLAVLADPANETKLFGTREDILIPSSCLNSIVSGLISRTVLRDDLIGEKDFHGAVYYESLKSSDLSYSFISAIEKHFKKENEENLCSAKGKGKEEVKLLAEKFGIDDINLVKPGIGETTRVLLRRLPWKIIIDPRFKNEPQLNHLLRLAQEKQVPVEECPLQHYKCCGLIKKISDV